MEATAGPKRSEHTTFPAAKRATPWLKHIFTLSSLAAWMHWPLGPQIPLRSSLSIRSCPSRCLPFLLRESCSGRCNKLRDTAETRHPSI